MKNTLPSTEPIILECDLPQPPALVWRALTERDLLGAWLLPNDIRPEVGARFSFERTDRQQATPIDCEVLEVEPNRTLRWRQTEDDATECGSQSVTSVVTIELTEADAGGTHLRLVHDEFSVATPTLSQPTTAVSATIIPLRPTTPPTRQRLDAEAARQAAGRSVKLGFGSSEIVCLLRRAA